MTLKEYLAEAEASKEALINKKSHNKYTAERLNGNKKPNRKDTGDAFLGKPRSARYRGDEHDVSKGKMCADGDGDETFTKMANANKYDGRYPTTGSRKRDETPSEYTSRKSSNKYDASRLGGDGKPNKKDTGAAFLGKRREAAYRSDEHEVSKGSPSRERKGTDLSFFTGKKSKE